MGSHCLHPPISRTLLTGAHYSCHLHLPFWILKTLETSTPPEGVQGGVRHSVLQGLWWDSSLDDWVFSGTDFMILILASPHTWSSESWEPSLQTGGPASFQRQHLRGGSGWWQDPNAARSQRSCDGMEHILDLQSRKLGLSPTPVTPRLPHFEQVSEPPWTSLSSSVKWDNESYTSKSCRCLVFGVYYMKHWT